MKNNKGFTLIEMIATLVILGVLLSLAAFNFVTIINKSKKTLNDEQKNRLVEVAKNVTLSNKNCLTLAKNSTDGIKINIDEMQKNGYLASGEIVDLENSTTLNSCIVVKWDNNYSKFDYFFSEECDEIQACTISAESEKVIISKFYLGEEEKNYTNKSNVNYNIKYTTSINAEYCVTLENEASCEWKKIDVNLNSITGTIKLKNDFNIAHLYVRNNNKNIISTLDASIIYDLEQPTCSWITTENKYINNGSGADIVLKCEDISGIKNAALLKDNLTYDSNMISVSDAIVTPTGNGKEFKFSIIGLTGNGVAEISLNSNVVQDNSGNVLNKTIKTSKIILDNTPPTATTSLENGKIYTNKKDITISLTNANDVSKVCITTVENNCSNYNDYKSTYTWDFGSDFESGSKTIYVYLKDRAGNVTVNNMKIYLDTQKPNCIINKKTENMYLKENDNAIFTISCIDNYSISDYALDSSSFIYSSDVIKNVELTKSSSSEYEVKFVANSGNADVRIYLKAGIMQDDAGNPNSQIEVANFKVDNMQPSVNSFVINKNTTITHLNLINIDFVASELGYYCATEQNNTNNCTWKRYNNISDVGSYTFINNSLEHDIYLFLKDLAGNVSTTLVTRRIKYDINNAVRCIIVKENNSLKIESPSTNLDSQPYSCNNQTWSNNRYCEFDKPNLIYYAYIKDNNGETNYCEYLEKD